MNLIHLNAHDLGRWLSPYGAAVPAPRLEELASRSLLFRNAHSVSPTCSPSRSAMLTGTYPHQNGVNGLTHRGFSLCDKSWHLANHLKAQGYHTALSGTQHENKGDSESIGYRQTLTPKGIETVDREERDPLVAKAAAEFLRTAPSQPFMLSVGFTYPHRVFPKGRDADRRAPHPLYPDTAESREDMAGFIRAVEIMDQSVGIVLDALAESGLADNTVILFTTDHGPAFPDMKGTLFEGGTGVALMLDFPGSGVRGQITDAMVSQLDLYPTLCELLRVPSPAHRLEGRSLAPLLANPHQPFRTELHTRSDFHAAYQPQRAVRTERYKIIFRYYDGPEPRANTDKGSTRYMLNTAGWQHRLLPRKALHDLLLDPLERTNLWDEPELQAERDRLVGILEAEMERTDDPLRHGPLKAPEGARLEQPVG